ncbi:MAG: hypothetical protein ABIP94_17150, partial [Planctomycetota bacterium]
RELWLRGPTFAAPAEGLVVVIHDADKQGFVVKGTAVAADSDIAVPSFLISRITWEGTGGSKGSLGTGLDGAFEVGPMAVGRRYSLEFEADGFAPALVGPFDATVRVENVTVRMVRCGTVRCRVLRADGMPAVKIWANLQRLGDHPFGRAWQGQTDADGIIEFHDVVPDDYKVHARASTAAGGTATVDTVVRPGQTSHVQLLLQ